jgi:hypothetical protein
MQIPVNNSGTFTKVSRSSSLPTSPRWSPCKGQAPDWVTPWIAPMFTPHVSGSPRWSLTNNSRSSSLSSFRPSHRGPCSLWYMVAATSQMRLVWSDKTTSPLVYNNGVRKYRVVRGMQTSLNIRPKPRANANVAMV